MAYRICSSPELVNQWEKSYYTIEFSIFFYIIRANLSKLHNLCHIVKFDIILSSYQRLVVYST